MEVNKMDWRRLIMDWGWLAVVVPLLAVAGTTIVSICQDNRGWEKVQNKIGKNKGASLEEQHDDIEKAIVEKTSSIYKIGRAHV